MAMKIQLLLTGNELMAGDIIDSNSAMVAEFLADKGWRIARKVTVGDEPGSLRTEIAAMASAADVLLINGGLGPTVDDLTATVLADVAGEALSEHPKALAHLEDWCAERGIALNAANRKQALLPAGADIIPNTSGSAVGIRMMLGNCLVLATPGVPSELRQMLRRDIMPLLSERFPADHIQTRRLVTFGIGESTLQQKLDREFPDWPEALELGFRASMPTVEVKLTVRSEADALLLDEWEARLGDFFGEHLLGPAPTSIAASAVAALSREQLRVSCAESCTGGGIAAQLTAIPGASQVFEGGFVTYSNAMKQAMLGVSAQSLADYGAVSESVAREMALGALQRSGADITVAVTGIAGPDGGSADKPVGTVWLAWGSAEQLQSQCLHLPYGREKFQQWVCAIALDLVRRCALGMDSVPRYLERHRKR